MSLRRLTIVVLASLGLLGLADRGGRPVCRADETAAAVDAPRREKIERIQKTLGQWKRQLTRRQFEVTRRAVTEPPFSGKLWKNKRPGVYRCVCCELQVFASQAKFESQTGWPSFWRAFEDDHLSLAEDRSDPAETRVEVLCARCDAHLGHVFADGPPPTGLRYCINSAALKFQEDSRALPGRETGLPGGPGIEPAHK